MLNPSPTASFNTTHGRLEYLDALRGIASISVVIYHFLLAEPSVNFGLLGQSIIEFARQDLDFGKFGVIVFFAISGFIIPYSFDKSSSAPVSKFIWHRLYRLYPAYWLSLAIIILCFSDSLNQDNKTVFLNLTMLQGFFGIPNINGVAWTLQIEIVFYVMCVVMFRSSLMLNRTALVATSLAMLLLALLMASARFYLGVATPVAMGLALSIMFFGSLWRLRVLDIDRASTIYIGTILITYTLIIPVVIYLAYNDPMDPNGPRRYLIAYTAAICFFCWCTYTKKISNYLIVHMGSISYSAYLMHTPVIHVARRLDLLPKDGAGPVVWWCWLVCMVGAVLLISHVTYIYIERPFVNFGRRLNIQTNPYRRLRSTLRRYGNL